MSEKINCQIIDILLNQSNEFTNKYCSVMFGNYDINDLLENNYINKNMSSIKIDNSNQSVCFTGQKEPVSFYNQDSKKSETYYEEIHIHCNNLENFDNLVNCLYRSNYRNLIDEVSKVPHYEAIEKSNFKNYELVLEPMTNELTSTRSLLNILSQRSNDTIFRALAIYTAKLVDKTSDVDIDLIHKLNHIYKTKIVNKENGFFSKEIFNNLLNINRDEKDYQSKTVLPDSEIVNELDGEYVISIGHEV
ncbi:MAG: hypothetical protein Q4G04_06805 [bacterium]|nr:hypothetical protein [bacterium]